MKLNECLKSIGAPKRDDDLFALLLLLLMLVDDDGFTICLIENGESFEKLCKNRVVVRDGQFQ